jgi:histone-lysine N-methyltransferase SETD3
MLDQEGQAWDMDGDPDIALVPWADMLNHSSAAGKGSCLVYNPNSRIASLHAHRSYNQGEEVYDSYGPGLSPSRLLLDYGFVDLENQNHAVDLPARIS